MKKIISIIVIISCLITLTGCDLLRKEQKVVTDAMKFKDEYEAINGEPNKNGKIHRVISLDEDSPIVYSSAEDILERINNKETFFVYFGSRLCPWCRSGIEMALKVAKEQGVEKIYYVDIWDNDGNEILRDTYVVNSKKKVEKKKNGTETYYKLLKKFDKVLRKYELTVDGKTYNTKEKRIYAPNYFFIKDGVAKKMVSGTSSKQKDSRDELTEEILNDQRKIFEEFFSLK